MRKLNKKRGMVLPLSLLAIIAVMGLVTSMSGLNQGVKTQIYRTNNSQLSFLIAYSAFSRICAKIHSFSWAKRPFLKEPYTETKVSLQGGQYDLLVEDTVGKKFQADIYIRTHLAGISRMYFWRIRVNEDLLDISNSIIVELYTTSDAKDFPTVSGPRKIINKVEDLLSKRAANQKKSDQLSFELIKIAKPDQIVEKLGGRKPAPFEKDWPTTPGDDPMAEKLSVNPPNVEPPPGAEKPSAPGPTAGSTAAASAYDSMTGIRINQLADKIQQSSAKLVESTDKGWTEIDEKGVGGIADAQQYWEEAAVAKDETYNALNQLIQESKNGIAEAPSASAQKAMEEMVAQTVVAGMTGVTTANTRSYEHLVKEAEGSNYSYLNGLPTSDSVEDLLGDWRAAAERTQEDLDRLTGLANSIDGYAMTPEVAQAMAESLEAAQKSLEVIQQAVAEAEARLAELKEKERLQAEAAEQQSQNNETP